MIYSGFLTPTKGNITMGGSSYADEIKDDVQEATETEAQSENDKPTVPINPPSAEPAKTDS